MSTAATPPMGWNSWDCFGASVTEEEIRENARYAAEHLLRFGWEYIVVDIQWYEPGADSSRYRPFVPLSVDGFSRLVPAENRFPSAAGGRGFAPLADFVHDLGLKFGIHIMRGIPRQAVHADTPVLGTSATARSIAHPNSICPWNTDMYGVDPRAEGAQAYYDSLFALYASWGVDFVKADDAAASRLYEPHLDEIALMRTAIDACGRPMVLSLSPGPAPVELAHRFAALAQMWRITDDFWDHWPALLDMFARCETWYPFVRGGTWPDCDMLPLGRIGIRSVDGPGGDRRTRFTRAEQRTMMTLWTIFRSPLFMGGHLPDCDDWTLSLLTNTEVLAMHRGAHESRPVRRDAGCAVWTARGEACVYAALFNLSDEPAELAVSFEELGLPAESSADALDLWEGRIRTAAGEIRSQTEAHGAALFKLLQ